MAAELRTSFVSTADGSLLRSVRSTIETADELLICVAFMSESGVELLAKEFTEAKRRGVTPRVLVTTSFGTTDATALSRADRLGLQVRIYNPSSGTFHPKLYLGRSASATRAFVGSANMTYGLTGNVEAGLSFEGSARHSVLRSAWDWASRLWDANDVVVEYPALTSRAPKAERFDATLYPLLTREIAKNPKFFSLPRKKVNVVTDVSETGLLVQTERSAPASEAVPAWMFNIAWSHLRLHGELTNDKLLNELRVHRSSAVRAILARVPGVTADGKGTLRWAAKPR